jgi:hypothetical protein
VPPGTRRTHGGLLATIATAAAVICAAGGVGLIGVALASRPEAPVAVAFRHVASPDEGRARPPSPAGNRLVLEESRPVTLDIPSIGVSSTIQHLGLEPDGSLETPAGPHYDEAAWYRYSPAPGSLGPAILLGHVDSAADGPSVFYRLGELRRGDLISVGRADGSTAEFTVDKVRRYAKDDFPTGLVYDDIDHAGLRILTCGGAFDATSGHYEDNVVVFASLR